MDDFSLKNKSEEFLSRFEEELVVRIFPSWKT